MKAKSVFELEQQFKNEHHERYRAFTRLLIILSCAFITLLLLIRLTHHATRCSVFWWRFAGRVKTAIPENTLGISVPVRN